MNRRLGVALLAGFLLGGLAGAFVMDSFAMAARPVLHFVLRANLSAQEEMLASRRAREGRIAESVVHRWNALRLSHSDSQDSLDTLWKGLQGERFLPPRLLALDRWYGLHASNSEPRRGAEIYRALLQRKLALTLRAAGFLDLADEQGAAAYAVLPAWGEQTWDELLEDESSPLHIAAENAVLDGINPANG